MMEKILEASKCMAKASELLREVVEDEVHNKKEDDVENTNKSTIQIILKGKLAKDDDLSEQFKKDLEEMLNDITEKRES